MTPLNGRELDIGLMLGRVLHGQEIVVARLDRIDDRLARGDRRMQSLADQIAEARRGREAPGAAERWIKHGLQYAVPLGVLWATGSLEKALAVMSALK